MKNLIKNEINKEKLQELFEVGGITLKELIKILSRLYNDSLNKEQIQSVYSALKSFEEDNFYWIKKPFIYKDNLEITSFLDAIANEGGINFKGFFEDYIDVIPQVVKGEEDKPEWHALNDYTKHKSCGFYTFLGDIYESGGRSGYLPKK